jgi:hypothetical protein
MAAMFTGEAVSAREVRICCAVLELQKGQAKTGETKERKNSSINSSFTDELYTGISIYMPLSKGNYFYDAVAVNVVYGLQ